MAQEYGKAEVSRETLKRNRIKFDPHNFLNYDNVPQYVQNFDAVLLDFNGVLEVKSHIGDGGEILYTTPGGASRRHDPEANDSANKKINWAKDVRRMVNKLQGEGAEEKRWDELFWAEFFRPLYEAWQPRDADSRVISRHKYFYDQFECHGDKLWTLFKSDFRTRDRKGLTQPKPDRFFSFKIHDTDSRHDSTQHINRWKWKGTPQENLIMNFSLRVLDDLWCQGTGLQHCPFRGQPKPGADSYRPQDLQCFPWLVVEHKAGSTNENKNAKDSEFCYCQAANASSAALMLFESAADHACPDINGQLVPPIPVITTVGRDVKVWIAWCDQEHHKSHYSMELVWRGDMMSIPAILELEAILENMHTWATRTLKPLLSKYIDCWSSAVS